MSKLHQIPPDEGSDEHLMQRICKGDRAAFELLYERYFDKLVWFAGSFLAEKPKAEDVVQEVFMKIIRKPQSFEQGNKFSTWVYTLTANLCKNTLRNEQNRMRLLVNNKSEESVNLNHSLDYQFLKNRIDETLKNMSEKERHIYTLRLEQELSIKEIAEIMQIPEGSVKSGIYYLLKKLAYHLKEFNYGKYE